MGGRQRDTKHDPATTTSTDESHSPKKGATTADGGYPEQHGPRFDADGWGEANAGRGGGDGRTASQGHQAGERSFDHGADDPIPDKAAGEVAGREPGERGADDAKPSQESANDAAPEHVEQPSDDFDGRQRDYGQGGGQGYVHTGKPGAPGRGDKSG